MKSNLSEPNFEQRKAKAAASLKRYLGSLPRGTEMHTIRSELKLQGFSFGALEKIDGLKSFDFYFVEGETSILAGDLRFDDESRLVEVNLCL